MAAKPWDGQWKHVRNLGEGGQGVTQVVKDASGREFVLKYLKNRSSIQARSRMIREVSNLKRMRLLTQQVPKVHDDNMHDSDTAEHLYFVMDLIAGQTLSKQVIVGQSGQLQTAKDYTLALARIIAIAHQDTILHRDLKPDNVMVRDSASGDLVLIDFGLSFKDDAENITDPSEAFRSKFLILPEAGSAGGDKRDQRSDVCAIVAMMFYCLTKETPGLLLNQDNQAPHQRPGSAFASMAGEAWYFDVNQFLTRGLAHSPQSRFQDIHEMMASLEAISVSPVSSREPATLLKNINQRLRMQDSTTKLALIRESAGKVHQLVQRELNNWMHGIKDCRFGLSSISPDGLVLPGGAQYVRQDSICISFRLQHHEQSESFGLLVGARADSAVVFMYAFPCHQGRVADRKLWAIREIATYKENPSEISATLLSEMNGWLSNAMESLYKRVTSGSETVYNDAFLKGSLGEHRVPDTDLHKYISATGLSPSFTGNGDFVIRFPVSMTAQEAQALLQQAVEGLGLRVLSVAPFVSDPA